MELDVASFDEDLGRSTVGARPQRVFVAEDDEDTREAIVAALAEEGHEVVGLEDGTELVECLRIVARESFRAPDLIAMDVCMPGHSGIDILEALRSQGCGTPVVLFSGVLTEDLRLRVARAGSSALLRKPFHLVELSKAVREARPLPRAPGSQPPVITKDPPGRT